MHDTNHSKKRNNQICLWHSKRAFHCFYCGYMVLDGTLCSEVSQYVYGSDNIAFTNIHVPGVVVSMYDKYSKQVESQHYFWTFFIDSRKFLSNAVCNFSYIFSSFELNGTCYDTSVLFFHDTKIEHLKYRVILQYNKNSLFDQTWCTNALYFAKNLHGMLLILSQKQIGESVTSMILFLFLIYFFCLGRKFHFLT